MNERFSFPDNIDATMWDLDGVLINTIQSDEKLARIAVVLALKSTGMVEQEAMSLVERVISADLLRKWIHIDIPIFWHLVLNAFKGATGIDLSAQKESIIKTYQDARNSEALPLLPGAKAAWEASPGRVGVVSTNFTSHIKAILKNSGLPTPDGLIVVGKDRVAPRKPDAAPWLYAAQLAGQPKRSLAIEDSVENLKGLHEGTLAAQVRTQWHLVGMGTGSASIEEMTELKNSGIINNAYRNL